MLQLLCVPQHLCVHSMLACSRKLFTKLYSHKLALSVAIQSVKTMLPNRTERLLQQICQRITILTSSFLCWGASCNSINWMRLFRLHTILLPFYFGRSQQRSSWWWYSIPNRFHHKGLHYPNDVDEQRWNPRGEPTAFTLRRHHEVLAITKDPEPIPDKTWDHLQPTLKSHGWTTKRDTVPKYVPPRLQPVLW